MQRNVGMGLEFAESSNREEPYCPVPPLLPSTHNNNNFLENPKSPALSTTNKSLRRGSTGTLDVDNPDLPPKLFSLRPKRSKEGSVGMDESPVKANHHFLRGGRKRGRLRHESTDTDADGSETSSTLERAPPDGGYGWVVVVAAFLINMVADGVTFSFGVYFVEFSKYFKESKAATAWIGSLLASLPLLSGPLASYLADRYGCRKVTIAGSLLASTGFLVASFAESMWMLYLTFGLITGIGLSLCYVAAVVIVAYYFEQRRSLATGISVCGGGIGILLFAPLQEHFIKSYGWQHTTRIIAGTFLLLTICGIFMRDLEWTKKSKNSQKSNAPSIDGLPGEISGSKSERLCSSALCIPTFVQEQERLSSSYNPRRSPFVQAHTLSYPLTHNPGPTPTHSNPKSKSATPADPYATEVLCPASLFNISSSSPLTSRGGPESSRYPNTQNTGLPPAPSHPNAAAIRNYVVTNTCSSGMGDGGMHRHSLTYRGAVLSLKRYRLRPASSCPDIISVATTDDPGAHEWKVVMADICKWFHSVCEWRNLSNSRYLLFLLSNFLLYMWYDTLYMYVQEAASKEGYDKVQSACLISIIGIFSVVGNLSLGYVGDKDYVDSTLVYGICMVICGISAMLIPTLMSWAFLPLAIGCAVFGLTIAANYSLITIILVQVVSLERFTSAYGLLLLVQGIGNLIGPPIAGVIYDWTGTISWSFLTSGIGILLSSVFILVPKIFNRCSSHYYEEGNNEEDDEEDQ